MTSAERETVILSLEPQVQMLAKMRIASLPPQARLDELVSAGWLGAIRAVDAFVPARGTELGTYADWKIRSAMADYLRSIDPIKRGHRRAIKDGKEPGVLCVSLDPGHDKNGRERETPRLAYQTSDERARREQARLDARLTLQAIYRRTGLQPRNARILKRWMEGESLKAIAQEHGIAESRASQICSNAIRKLRAAA